MAVDNFIIGISLLLVGILLTILSFYIPHRWFLSKLFFATSQILLLISGICIVAGFVLMIVK